MISFAMQIKILDKIQKVGNIYGPKCRVASTL